jgi:phosphogluconate dehydratase
MPNIAIVSAYNDMLSAHQPLAALPDWIKQAARSVGATAQFAGGVPAMCDGVTQGMAGMELSLFSRDVIAMSTAVALSHNMFDATLCLGVRQDRARPVDRRLAVRPPANHVCAGRADELPACQRRKSQNPPVARRRQTRPRRIAGSRSQAYHGPGTCTFYGTANSNQMLMEVMGLHLPGSGLCSSEHAAARCADPRRCAARAAQPAGGKVAHRPDDRRAQPSSTPSWACWPPAARPTTRCTWWRWRALRASASTGAILMRCRRGAAAGPRLPNGKADVNHFHAAGGMGFLIRELLGVGLLHADVRTVAGPRPARLHARANAAGR